MPDYILTEDNIKLLKIIYSYGAYTRVAHIEKLFKGYSYKSLWMKLEKLEAMNYLTSRRLKTNSKREQKNISSYICYM